MSEHDDLFSRFSRLQPAPEQSERAVLKTREAILTANVEPADARDDSRVEPADRRRSRFGARGNGRFQRHRFYYAGLATVAGILVLLVVSPLFIPPSAFAWSDVVRGMVGAQSLHCVAEFRLASGQWVPGWEITYAEHLGFERMHYDEHGLQRTQVDDGKSDWVHRRGERFATRQSTLGLTYMLNDLFDPLKTERSFLAEPKKDEVIDGVKCRCFIATDEAGGRRRSVWIDADKHLRRSLVDRSANGQWAPWFRAGVQYGIDIDSAAFKPHFGAEIKIVDLPKLFEEVCPIDKAVYREVKFGYIFAIHELKRLGDCEYYMLVSLRPTEETRKKIAMEAGEVAGHLFPTFRATVKPPVEQETTFPLAWARADGIEVSAYVGEDRGFELSHITRARPKFQLNSHPKLWNTIGAYNDIQFDLPLPDEVTPREEVVRSAYDMISTLEAVPMDELYLNDPLDDRVFTDVSALGFGVAKGSRKHMPKPSEISFETFFQHMEKLHAASRPKTTVEKE